MSKVVILGVKTYSFENERNERVEGARLTYLPFTKSIEGNEIGYAPLTSNVNLECLKTLKDIPGQYDCKYEMVAGKNNKPTLKVTGFDFIKTVDLDILFE